MQLESGVTATGSQPVLIVHMFITSRAFYSFPGFPDSGSLRLATVANLLPLSIPDTSRQE